MLFLTVSEKKNKVRLIFEISEFSYLELGQIRKLGNLGNSPSFTLLRWNSQEKHENSYHHCKSRLDKKFNSVLKLAKIFPRFLSFRICLIVNTNSINANVNLGNQLNFTLLLWNSQEKHVNSCHNYKSQLDINLKSFLKLRKKFFRNFRVFQFA